jgi:hypothetical protein
VSAARSRGLQVEADTAMSVRRRGWQRIVSESSPHSRAAGRAVMLKPEPFQGVAREQVAEGLRPLLELPVEVVLATHGGPVA